jgi:hypothetical protein
LSIQKLFFDLWLEKKVDGINVAVYSRVDVVVDGVRTSQLNERTID